MIGASDGSLKCATFVLPCRWSNCSSVWTRCKAANGWRRAIINSCKSAATSAIVSLLVTSSVTSQRSALQQVPRVHFWSLAVRTRFLLTCCVAVSIGRNEGFTRPSVCPRVMYGLLTRKQKCAEKPKLVQTFLRVKVTNVSIFSSKARSQG